jgi:hypothetical protein
MYWSIDFSLPSDGDIVLEPDKFFSLIEGFSAMEKYCVRIVCTTAIVGQNSRTDVPSSVG